MLDRMKGPILKSRDEIAVMDRANNVVLETLEILRGMIKPGVTTAQLNAVAEEELARRGAKSPFKGYAPMSLPPYPAVLCASSNDVIVHGIPNRGRLQEGDVVGLDFGSILDGFVGDGAITVGAGKVRPGMELREGMVFAIEPMLCEIGPKLRSRIERAGKDGMIEDVRTDADRWTARTVDGSLAAHFEFSVAITGNGPQVLGK